MDAKRTVLATHVAVFVLGIVSGVLGNFATDAVRSVIAGPVYSYGPTVPACGSDKDLWTPQQARIHCSATSNVMTLVVQSEPATGEVGFAGKGTQLPSDYRASVTVSHSSSATCAGLLIRGHTSQGTGYVSFICSRGVWEIARFDPGAAQPVVLATGVLPESSQQVYTVALQTQGSTYQLLINGVVSGGGDENLYPGTQEIALVVSPLGSADFSDFMIQGIR